MMNTLSTSSILDFLERVDGLKMIYRAGYLCQSDEKESVTDHTWHMALFAMLLHRETDQDCDLEKVLELIIVHDLAEVIVGDTFAHDKEARIAAKRAEKIAAKMLFENLPRPLGQSIFTLWHEFEDGATKESRFAHALDKLQALAQNVSAGGRVWAENGITETRSKLFNEPILEEFPSLKPYFDALYEKAKERNLWPKVKSMI